MEAALLGLLGFAVVVAALVVVTSRNASGERAVGGRTSLSCGRAADGRPVCWGRGLSRGEGAVLAQLVDGTIPAGIDRLTVLIDVNCVPGRSWRLALPQPGALRGAAGRGEGTLEHHQRLAEEPWLASGELVILNV